MYINDVNSEYSLESFLHHPCLFFLTVNRRLQYLLIEFTVGGSLSDCFDQVFQFRQPFLSSGNFFLLSYFIVHLV